MLPDGVNIRELLTFVCFLRPFGLRAAPEPPLEMDDGSMLAAEREGQTRKHRLQCTTEIQAPAKHGRGNIRFYQTHNFFQQDQCVTDLLHRR